MATLLHQNKYMKSLSNTTDGTQDETDDDLLNNSLLGGMTTTSDFLDGSGTHQTNTINKQLMPHEMVNMHPIGHSSASSSNIYSHHHNNHTYSNHTNHYSQNNSYYSFQSSSLFNNNSLVNTVGPTIPILNDVYQGNQNFIHTLNNGHHSQNNSHQNAHQQSHHHGSHSFGNPPHLIAHNLIHNQNFQIKNEVQDDSTTNLSNSAAINGDMNVADVTELKSEVIEEQQQIIEQQQPETEQEPEPEIDIVINNVVCSFAVRCHLNLKEIALNGHNVEFRRENGMVTMKLRKPYTTASIWSSGRITCTGATSEDQAKIAARRYARILQNLGFRVRFSNFRVVNVLGTCSMPFAIKIVNFSEKYKKEASYEPELHPGVTYKIKEPKATLKIFSTGSVTVTANSVAHVQAAIEHIFPLVYEFRKPRPVNVPVTQEVFLMENAEEDVGDIIEGPESDDDEEEEENTTTEGPNRKRASKKTNKVPAKRSRRPAGKAENDPLEDLISVSDIDEDENKDVGGIC